MRGGFLGRAKFHLSRFDSVVVFKPRMNTDDHGWMGVLLEPRKTRNEGEVLWEGEVPPEPV